MPAARNLLTSKGQVTIPVAVRRQLGVGPGDAVEFASGQGGVLIRKARPSAAEVAALIEAIAGAADRRLDMTPDEVLDAMRPHRSDPA